MRSACVGLSRTACQPVTSGSGAYKISGRVESSPLAVFAQPTNRRREHILVRSRL